jgi:hypothetical protein
MNRFLLLAIIAVNTACYQHCLADRPEGYFDFLGKDVLCVDLCSYPYLDNRGGGNENS